MARSALRFDESERRLDSLRGEISEWSEDRRRRDVRRQFFTQLSGLETTLISAIERLSAILGQVKLAVSTAGEIYETCREFDDELLIVRRLWRWYADKFDQRDHRRYGRVLSAADEVVWALYAGVLRSASGGQVPGSAPLAYLDDLGAPEATPRDEPPAGIRRGGHDEALGLLLARLPIPVVGLPAGTAEEPWQLALLGHEVGHHLQYDLLPDAALVGSVGTAVASAAGGGAVGDQWRWWSRELFADLSGLVTLGPASVDTLLPLELGSDGRMMDRERGVYPAPVVRFAVIDTMAAELGLALDDQIGATVARSAQSASEPSDPRDPQELARAAVRADLAHAPKVAAALVAHVVAGSRTLPELCAFSADNFAAGGPVFVRARQLVSRQGVPRHGLAVVRSLVSASVLAWQQVSVTPDSEKRHEALQTLGREVIDRIVGSAEEGTRGSRDAVAAPTAHELVGSELAAILTRGLTR